MTFEIDLSELEGWSAGAWVLAYCIACWVLVDPFLALSVYRDKIEDIGAGGGGSVGDALGCATVLWVLSPLAAAALKIITGSTDPWNRPAVKKVAEEKKSV